MARNDSKKAPPPEPDIDARAIRDLARLLDETGLSEIEVEHGGKRIKVARQLMLHAAPVAPTAATTLRAPVTPPTETVSPGPAADLSKHPGAVTSPMVGTAFLAPEPDASPFVKAGDTVTKGQTLLIIDAMKTMNPIPSPKAGKVIEVLVSNGSPVEFGQALMIIE